MKASLVIAHRGASAVAPEGTAAAIREAVRAGAAMVELDVQMTRDGRLVIFHDERLERTTNGHGVLRRARFADVARLDAGGWFHPRFSGERVLLVSQALRLIPPRIGVNLELKRTRTPRPLVEHLLRLLRRVPRRRCLALSSFDPRLLRLVKRSGRPLALICRRQPDRSLRQAVRLGCAAWHPVRSLVTTRRVAAAHAAGLRVRAWTVDDVRTARRLMRMGVDGLFTNDPARLVQALSRTIS
jgi:glycerophosphoryl diester phosphodiesterase